MSSRLLALSKLQLADTAVNSLDGPRGLQQGTHECRTIAMERSAIIFVSFVAVLAVVNSGRGLSFAHRCSQDQCAHAISARDNPPEDLRAQEPEKPRVDLVLSR